MKSIIHIFKTYKPLIILLLILFLFIKIGFQVKYLKYQENFNSATGLTHLLVTKTPGTTTNALVPDLKNLIVKDGNTVKSDTTDYLENGFLNIFNQFGINKFNEETYTTDLPQLIIHSYDECPTLFNLFRAYPKLGAENHILALTDKVTKFFLQQTAEERTRQNEQNQLDEKNKELIPYYILYDIFQLRLEKMKLEKTLDAAEASAADAADADAAATLVDGAKSKVEEKEKEISDKKKELLSKQQTEYTRDNAIPSQTLKNYFLYQIKYDVYHLDRLRTSLNPIPILNSKLDMIETEFDYLLKLRLPKSTIRETYVDLDLNVKEIAFSSVEIYRESIFFIIKKLINNIKNTKIELDPAIDTDDFKNSLTKANFIDGDYTFNINIIKIKPPDLLRKKLGDLKNVLIFCSTELGKLNFFNQTNYDLYTKFFKFFIFKNIYDTAYTSLINPKIEKTLETLNYTEITNLEKLNVYLQENLFIDLHQGDKILDIKTSDFTDFTYFTDILPKLNFNFPEYIEFKTSISSHIINLENLKNFILQPEGSYDILNELTGNTANKINIIKNKIESYIFNEINKTRAWIKEYTEENGYSNLINFITIFIVLNIPEHKDVLDEFIKFIKVFDTDNQDFRIENENDNFVLNIYEYKKLQVLNIDAEISEEDDMYDDMDDIEFKFDEIKTAISTEKLETIEDKIEFYINYFKFNNLMVNDLQFIKAFQNVKKILIPQMIFYLTTQSEDGTTQSADVETQANYEIQGNYDVDINEHIEGPIETAKTAYQDAEADLINFIEFMRLLQKQNEIQEQLTKTKSKLQNTKEKLITQEDLLDIIEKQYRQNENQTGIQHRMKIQKEFFNLSQEVRVDYPLLDILVYDNPITQGKIVPQIYFINNKIEYGSEIASETKQEYIGTGKRSLYDEKQTHFDVKGDFSFPDILKFMDYSFTCLCWGAINIRLMKHTNNHYYAFPCQNKECQNDKKSYFYLLPTKIAQLCQEEGKEYTRAKCNRCASNVIVYFDKIPQKFLNLFNSTITPQATTPDLF